MVPGPEQVHHVGPRQKQRHRIQPATEGLAEHEHIRLDSIVLTRQKQSGPAKAGLDLVADQQYPVARADVGALGQVSRLRHANASLTLYGFDEKCCGLGCNGIAQRGCIAVFHQPETGRKRPEIFPVLLLRGHRDGAQSPAVEVASAGNDFGPVCRHFLDFVGPFSHGFDGGLDGLRARVHWQGTVHRGQLAGAL